MVYRLHRATKSLFVKVLIVILLYSMIIGFFGWIFIGFAATFDTQSFHYNLVDSNPVEDANERILCEQIEQECDWNTLQTLKDDISFQELDNTPVKSLLEAFQLKFDRGNYYAVNESSTSTLTLAEANIRFNFDGIWIDSTTSIPISDLGMVNSGTNIPGELIDDFNIGIDQGLDFCAFSGVFPSDCNNNFYVIDGIRGYDNFTFGTRFLGSHVLLANGTNDILCYDWVTGCSNYNRIDIETYQLDGSSTNISAYQAIIQPIINPIIIDRLPVPLTVTNTIINFSGVPNVICINEEDDCGIKGVGFIRELFVFMSSLDPTLIMTGEIVLNPILEFDGHFNPFQQFNELCSYVRSDFRGFEESPGNFGECVDPGGNLFHQVPEIVNSELNDESPRMVIFAGKDDSDNIIIQIKFAVIEGVEDKNTFGVFFRVLFNPSLIWDSFNTRESPLRGVFIVSIGLLIINIFVGILVIIFQLWRLGARLSPNVALLLRGRLGRLLELTQFFKFTGEWYLESSVIQDYDFTKPGGTIQELVNERWRDTFFFPAALSAAFAILMVALIADPLIFFSIFIFAALAPILLFIWTPIVWTLEDGGLKRD